MKGIKGVRLGIAGAVFAALVAVGGLLLASQVSATSGTLSIGSATIAPNATGSVDLKTNVGAPGLGAWTVDITYDPSVVKAPTTASRGCVAQQNGVCNPEFEANKIRVTGASANGLAPDTDTVLATIPFTCLTTGTSALTLTTNVFADSTVGNPQSFTPTITNGSITCAVPPTATSTPLPTLVPSGQGPSSDGSLTWLVAGLAALGLAGLAGYGVVSLRQRAR